MDLFVGEVFEKYMLKSNEPFLFYCSIPPYTRYRTFSFLLLYTTIYKVQNLLFSTALYHHIQGTEPFLFYCSIPPYTRYRTFSFLLPYTTIYKVQNLLFSTALLLPKTILGNCLMVLQIAQDSWILNGQSLFTLFC